tara:strand:- start:1683 stop:2006 length:324 start_codon:yes stop_codon:yes gene_type:complete
MLLYLYIAIIFLLSSTPPSVVSSIQIYGLDKIIHFVEYFILGIIFRYSINKLLSKYYFLVILIPIIDEFIIQNYSGRNVDVFDFIANILGLIFGIFISKEFFKNKVL